MPIAGARLAIGLLAGLFLVSPVDAADDGAAARTARARAVLASHCARCHQGDHRVRPDATSSIVDILDLAALARLPHLVRPGNPDGSPLYAEMVQRRMPPSGEPAAAEPSAAELGAVREWIEGLGPREASCPPPRLSSHAGGGLGAWPLKPSQRVVTLAHLDDGCRSTAQLAAWRSATVRLVAALAGRPLAQFETGAAARPDRIVIDLADLGWDARSWATILGASGNSRTSNAIVRADWLAATILRGPLGDALVGERSTKVSDNSALRHDKVPDDGDRRRASAILATVTSPPELTGATGAFLDLVAAYRQPPDLSQLARELAMAPDALRDRGAEHGGAADLLVSRLIHGTVPRSEIETVTAVMMRLRGDGGATDPMPPAAQPHSADRPSNSVAASAPGEVPRLWLAADKARYRVGDSLQLHVGTDIDCHLTLISIDAKGRGTVILPSDLSSNMPLSAPSPIVVPAPGAGYRLRLMEPGRERIVALCSRVAGRVDGIRHDFERQRFQELGHYATHLGRALAEHPAASGSNGRLGAERAGGDRATRENPLPVPRPLVARTGLLLHVD